MQDFLSRLRLRGPDRDRGMTLVELLISGVIGVIVLGLVTTLFISSMKRESAQAERQTALAEVEGVSAMLMRDVHGGTRLHEATSTAFTVERVIEGVCEVHAYTVDDGVVSLETSKYPGDKCTGTPVSSTTTHAKALAVDDVFTYFGKSPTALADPVRPSDVKRVAWKLERTLTKSTDSIVYESAAAFSGRSSTTGTGAPSVTPKAPLLEIITDRSATGVIGIHAPVLQWRDDTALAVASWSIYRVATADGVAAEGGWKLLTVLANGDTAALTQTLTFTDSTLPAGHTAQYVVRANPISGKVGPSSNQVSSGLRPSVTQGLRVVGDTQSISVSWTAQTGATRYDLYRDGVLYKKWSQIASTVTRSGNTISWVDATGYGHAHTYTVVASNRWELAATHPQGAWQADSQTREPEVGTQLSAKLGAAGKLNARLAPAVAGAWTAPTTPAIKAFTNRQPADVTNVSATWDTTLEPTWDAAVWTGAWAEQAKAATRYTLTRGSTTIVNRGTVLRAADKDAPRGVSSTWTLVADAGDNTASPAKRLSGASTTRALLTWPAAPVCAAGAGSPATSAATVTITRPSGQTVTATRARLTAVGARPSATTYASTPRAVGYMVAGDAASFTNLSHSTAHTWRAQAQNASGYGPWGANCSRTTGVVGIPTLTLNQGNATGGQKTRALTGAMTFTGGGTITRTLTPGQGGAASQTTGANAPVWTQLRHNTSHTLRVTNSDGFNTFTKSVSRSTVELTGTLTLVRDAAKPTRALNATITSTWASAHTMTLTPGISGAGTMGSTAKTRNFDKLADGVNHTLRAVLSDGYNTNVAVKTPKTASTALLSAPSVSVTARTTRAITAKSVATAQNGTAQTIKLGSGSYYSGSKKFDPLKHGTSYTLTARNSDGHNARTATATSSTTTLAAPSCWSNTAGTVYPPVTLSWGKSAASVWDYRQTTANSAGTYYAAVYTSDGYNRRDSSCSKIVSARPWVNLGAGDPGRSVTCEPYLGWGEVQTLLRSAVQVGGQIANGYYIGAPVSGSYSADKGAHLRGSVGDRSLQCTMYRAHHVYLSNLSAQPVGRFGASAVWSMGGLGAH